jgi:hypothetical protein
MLLLAINLLFTSGMTFAFWASSILGANPVDGSGNVDIGDWFDGYIPIFNEQEFMQVITTDQNTGHYILARDMDFEFVLPSEWIQTKDIVFKGLLEGNNKAIRNIDLIDYRGIFGVLEGATIRNLTLDSININYAESNTYTSGILAGRIQGVNNLIENVHITNSSINNVSVLSGGLVGYVYDANLTGSAIIKDVSILNTTISGGYTGATYGNGGVIGTLNNFNLTLENVLVDVEVTSPNATNAGGIIGATLGTNSISLTNIDVNDSLIQINTAGATLGAGGIVGYLVGQNHTFDDIEVTNTTVTSLSSSGGMIGYATQTSTNLNIDTFNLDGNTISSSLASTTSGNGGVIGTLIGYQTVIQNGTIQSDITSTAGTNAGGIIGANTSTATITLDNIDLVSSNVTINGTGTTLGAGGAIGYLVGSGHTFTDVDLQSTTITSNSSSGGLVGYATQASGTLIIDGTNITNGSVNSSLSSATLGNGGVIGSLLGYTLELSNSTVSSTITSTTTTNAGGIIGANNAASKMNLTAVNVENSVITINGSNTALGAGGVIGLALGFGHSFQTVRVFDTSITASNSTGGLIGRFNGSSGISNFNNIKAQSVTTNSTVANNTISSGGMIGYVQGSGTDLRFFDIYVEGLIQTTNANVGGVIGYTASGSIVRVTRVVIFANLLLNTPANNTDRGAGGIVGRHAGTTFQVTDGFYAGDLKSRNRTNRPYSGIVRAIGNTVTVTNMRSTEVRYWTSGTSYTLITTSTLYGNLRGQNPGYTFHTNLRSSLNNAYWMTNYGSFSTSIWTYNPTTYIYELND